jgi:GDP-mannose 6-dehydrogenase
MKIAIFGLGYVGAVTGSCLASFGHSVTLIEVDSGKVDIFLSGRSPISEPNLEEIISSGLRTGNLNATTNIEFGLTNVDCILISVGTPSDSISGAPDLKSITSVAKTIAQHLIETQKNVAIALCSTVPPNTTEHLFRRILEEAGVHEDKYSLAFIPEFLREGSAIRDFMEPSRIIVGVRNPSDSIVFMKLRPELAHITQIVPIEIAEMLKTVENSWHALKITFANEVARICEPLKVDSSEVMNLLILDSRQNISPAYLRPGFAFGGSCLPKDLRSLQFIASSNNVSVPVIESIIESNLEHTQQAINLVLSESCQKITVLGLAFKANTDDLRESPAIALIKVLLEGGSHIKSHDFNLNPDKLLGANRIIWDSIPRLNESFFSDLDKALSGADTVIVAQYEQRYKQILASLPNSVRVINLVKL